MAFYGRTGLSGGGILSPGLLALQGASSRPLIATVAAALLLLPLIEGAVRLLGLYGRQRLAFALLAALALRGFLPFLLPPGSGVPVWVGWVVPGLVAADMERQGIVPTVAALILLTASTLLLGGLLP
ncbi:capsule biosynthesis protein CapC [Aminithiophilus ramosus]|uniref:Capsule biosynthesis protein CapC n=3 Tax=Synergistia TaxID=649775 RepID=A0A9Q7AFI3_9BACT|nr:capsule biosynthesis protein CapC [Aminithiophilus ramosus]QVL37527.1 capsule biosynthesis protein CapC [Synergistota bacterium]